MKFLVTLILLISFLQNLYSQNIIDTGSIENLQNLLINSKNIKYKGIVDYELWGHKSKYYKYLIKDKVKRTYGENRSKLFKESIELYISCDSNNLYKKKMINLFKQQFKIPNFKGIIFYEGEIILYFNGDGENRFGKTFTIWGNERIYHFNSIKMGGGFGDITNFIMQYVSLKCKFGICYFGLTPTISEEEFIKYINDGLIK